MKQDKNGFRIYNGTTIYVAPATVGGWSARKGKPEIRKELVAIMRDIWNNDPSVKKMRKHIKRVTIKHAKTIDYCGMWKPEDQQVIMIDDGIITKTSFKCTAYHEIVGHTFWSWAQKWRREELIAFNKKAIATKPINDYVRDNEQEWKEYNDEKEDTYSTLDKKYGLPKGWGYIENYLYGEKLEQYYKEYEAFMELRKTDGHQTMTRYANEQHSAMTEIIFGFGGAHHRQLISDEDLVELKALWEALHY